MPRKNLFLLHTSAALVPMFAELCKTRLPGVRVSNMVDDSLIQDMIAHGCLQPRTVRRVTQWVAAAEDAGADYILATCSSIGKAVETAATISGVPVMRIDRPMAEMAVQMGERVGVIATLQTTLEPTSELVQRCADKAGKEIKLTSLLCQGAFEALMSGDAAKHDAMVTAALRELMSEVNVIVLAQASMARVVDSLPVADKRVPILASPRLAMDLLAKVL